MAASLRWDRNQWPGTHFSAILVPPLNISSSPPLAEVIIPAGTSAPIQDEGYRYLPLDTPITLAGIRF